MDLNQEIKCHYCKIRDSHYISNKSNQTEGQIKINYLIQQKIYDLEIQLKTINTENEELKRINKVLSTKIDFLVNHSTIVKNVKNEMNDYSLISHYNNQETLKEFFFLTVICEKMNYLNNDKIWSLDSNILYNFALKNDLLNRNY